LELRPFSQVPKGLSSPHQLNKYNDQLCHISLMRKCALEQGTREKTEGMKSSSSSPYQVRKKN